MLGVYFELYHTNQFCFFYNLGYSKKTLYAGVAALDFAVWVTVCVTTIAITA